MSAGRNSVGNALAAILLWGTLAAVVGHALDGVGAGPLLVWSLGFAAVTLSGSHLLRGGRTRALLPSTPRQTLLGLWGILGYHALFFVALARAPIVEANLLNYLWPLLVVLLAGPLGGQPANAAARVGAVVGFAGAVVVVTGGKAIAFEPSAAIGYACAVLAALSWSSFSVLLGRGKGGAREANAANPMIGFVNVSFVGAVVLGAVHGDLHPLGTRATLAAAWLGVGPMALAFLCWERAMRHGSAARIGALSYLDPLLSTVLLALALGRPLTPAIWIGMALIVSGAAVPTVLSLTNRQGELG